MLPMDTMLVLNINPEVEEDLVDYLLELDCVSGFTSYPVRGHGHGAGLSIAEQVSGQRKRIQIELVLNQEQSERVIQGLQDGVGTDISWWELPLRRFGRV